MSKQPAFRAVVLDLYAALDCWHRQWSMLRDSAMKRNEWDWVGFFKNGDQYEAATRLLLSEKAEPLIPALWPVDANRLELLRSFNRQESLGERST